MEPEIRQWLELLPARQYKAAERAAIRLADAATTLGEPHARHLGGKVRELRYTIDGEAIRITYWLAPARRIVLLTVFRKTKARETAEVDRAHQAQKLCEAEHEVAHDTYSRDIEEEL
ncbi:type II toxin-antitoxin system RelE/ParE family toxin [Streptomyces sp. NPDC091292]|uniref:type II toxin-antitoxin system RelE/ParE family toxin n=1 Tax=Streptomyces sp. NPDC091292 TaxID=3365991 RepID=UPI0037F371E7